jgi:hypothetical protein
LEIIKGGVKLKKKKRINGTKDESEEDELIPDNYQEKGEEEEGQLEEEEEVVEETFVEKAKDEQKRPQYNYKDEAPHKDERQSLPSGFLTYDVNLMQEENKEDNKSKPKTTANTQMPLVTRTIQRGVPAPYELFPSSIHNDDVSSDFLKLQDHYLSQYSEKEVNRDIASAVSMSRIPEFVLCGVNIIDQIDSQARDVVAVEMLKEIENIPHKYKVMEYLCYLGKKDFFIYNLLIVSSKLIVFI